MLNVLLNFLVLVPVLDIRGTQQKSLLRGRLYEGLYF